MTLHFTDPRLTALAEGTSDDPIGDALVLLKTWKDWDGVTLTRAHVETAARWTGADFGLLWSIILSPATH